MKQGDLRGCIGTFDSSQNLKSLLSKYALISALEDDRFGPMKLSEVP
jgi:AMMECR1 domain-containing protein